MKQWANLDFLRSVAVLLVVFVHTMYYRGRFDLIGWGGLIGVSYFFVHTSLVLMWSLERDAHVGRFYLRRIFRIYPLWIAVFCLVVLLKIPTSPSFAPQFGFYKPLLRQIPGQLLLTFNIRQSLLVVGASWTLPLEVDMYIFLPALFFFVRETRKLWPLLVIAGFVMFWDASLYGASPAIFPMCVPYFLGGIVAYQQSKKVQPKLPSWMFPTFLFLLTAVAYNHTSHRRNWAVCMALGLALPHFRQMTWKPVVVASHYIARYSYGVYLGHFVAIAVGFYYLAGRSLALRLAAYTLTLIVLPMLFYHLIEEPMIRVGSKLARKIGNGAAPRVTEETLHLEPAP